MATIGTCRAKHQVAACCLAGAEASHADGYHESGWFVDDGDSFDVRGDAPVDVKVRWPVDLEADRQHWAAQVIWFWPTASERPTAHATVWPGTGPSLCGQAYKREGENVTEDILVDLHRCRRCVVAATRLEAAAPVPARPGHPLPVGTRVRNYGEQYPHALRHGTAVIVEIGRSCSDGSVEYVVEPDVINPARPNQKVLHWNSDRTVAVEPPS